MYDGSSLNIIRKTRGLTVEQFSNKSNIHIGTIRQYLYEKREPSASNLYKMSIALGVTMESFFEERRSAAGKHRSKTDQFCLDCADKNTCPGADKCPYKEAV